MTEPAQSPDDQLYMRHPDVDGPPAPVSRRQLEDVWTHKGWSEVDPQVVDRAVAVAHTPEQLEGLTKPQLAEVAETLGVDTKGKTKEQLKEETRAAAESGQQPTS